MSMAWSDRLWELNNWFNYGLFTDRWGSAGSCQCALISVHDSTPKLGNASNLFTKVEDLALFFLPIIFKPYCVSKEIQSICFCFFKPLLFCKSYLMSQSLMSLNKATRFPTEGYRSLRGINETRTSGILDLIDLYHISRVSLNLSFLFWRASQ